MPTAFEGFKSGNTIIPCKDVNAVDWSNYARTGVHNQFNIADITTFGQWTYANGEFKNNVTDTRANLAFQIQGRKDGTFVKNLLGIDCGTTGKYSADFTIAESDDINQLYIGHTGTSTDIKFVLSFTKKGDFKVRFNATGIDPTTVNGIVIKELMITDATDTFEGYTDFAMTNGELTEEVIKIDNKDLVHLDTVHGIDCYYCIRGNLCYFSISGTLTEAGNVTFNVPLENGVGYSKAFIQTGDTSNIVKIYIYQGQLVVSNISMNGSISYSDVYLLR